MILKFWSKIGSFHEPTCNARPTLGVKGNTLSVHVSNMRSSHESIRIAALRGEIAIDITRIAKGILARGAATQQGVLATSSSHVMREATLTLPYGIKGEEDYSNFQFILTDLLQLLYSPLN